MKLIDIFIDEHPSAVSSRLDNMIMLIIDFFLFGGTYCTAVAVVIITLIRLKGKMKIYFVPVNDKKYHIK